MGDTNWVDGRRETVNPLMLAVMTGDAYRVSGRQTLADGEEFIVHFDPVAAGGTIHIEPPAVLPDAAANIAVWENADPGANLVDDLFVHNMRYDGQEQPDATIQRVSNGGLTTTSADQTEESRVIADINWNAPAGVSQRGIWRTIPVGETVTIVITDDSGGSNNVFSFDTVVYEGDSVPE